MKQSTGTPALLAMFALVSACSVVGPAKITGGGTLNSAGGASKAVMTVNADTCGSSPKGRITYDDRTAVDFERVGGVSFRADIVKAGLCLGPPANPNDPAFKECTCPAWPAVVADYVSTNPAAPGSGKAYACFQAIPNKTQLAGGKHVVLVDQVRLVGGPFDSYLNQGTMDGNIQVNLSCPAAP